MGGKPDALHDLVMSVHAFGQDEAGGEDRSSVARESAAGGFHAAEAAVLRVVLVKVESDHVNPIANVRPETPAWLSDAIEQCLVKDPKKRLKGSGNTVRHIVLKDAASLDDPDIKALMGQCLKIADPLAF